VNYNNDKLRGRIAEKYKSVKNFAEHTSRKAQFIRNVLKGKAVLTRDDIDEWIALLEIEPQDIMVYFFTR